MKISEVITPDNVYLGVSVKNKKDLLKFVSETAGAATGIEHRKIFSGLLNREEFGSTGIGSGIAIPHTPIQGLSSLFALFVRLEAPIEFDAIDDEKVDVVCAVITPSSDQSDILKLLSTITRQLRREDTLNIIRQTNNRTVVFQSLTDDSFGARY